MKFPNAPGKAVVEINTDTPFSGTALQMEWSKTRNRLLLRNTDALVPAPFEVVVKG